MNDVGSMNVFKVAVPVSVRAHTPQLFNVNEQKTRRQNTNKKVNLRRIIVTKSQCRLSRFVCMEFVVF